MSSFLENLKNAADNGEFNSDAAKKILDIDKLADTKLGSGTSEDVERLQEKLEKNYGEQVKPVSEEEAIEMNSQYEKKMEQLRMLDSVNSQLAMLIEMDDMVKASIGDVMSFVNGLETNFMPDMGESNPLLKDLTDKINEVKSNYKDFIN